jgi:DNA-binding NarL/FixJ family response regulator
LIATDLIGGLVPVSTTRVLVVDDFAPWRRMVRLTLSDKTNIQIVAEAENGMAAIQKALEFKPDVAILDIGLPDLSGIEVAREISASLPGIRILFLTENNAPEVVQEAINTGALGFVLKSSAARDLAPAMEAILQDTHFISLGAGGTTKNTGNIFRNQPKDH